MGRTDDRSPVPTWTDFRDDCADRLPAWGTLEGSARLFQPSILGLIADLFIAVMVVSIYRALSCLIAYAAEHRQN